MRRLILNLLDVFSVHAHRTSNRVFAEMNVLFRSPIVIKSVNTVDRNLCALGLCSICGGGHKVRSVTWDTCLQCRRTKTMVLWMSGCRVLASDPPRSIIKGPHLTSYIMRYSYNVLSKSQSSENLRVLQFKFSYATRNGLKGRQGPHLLY